MAKKPICGMLMVRMRTGSDHHHAWWPWHMVLLHRDWQVRVRLVPAVCSTRCHGLVVKVRYGGHCMVCCAFVSLDLPLGQKVLLLQPGSTCDWMK